jgi:hypothetical protein
MELYDDGWGHCFVCGAHIKMLDAINTPPRKVQEPEDVETSIRQIKQLPIKWVRGLQLHSNDRGYYIIWPDNNYYKFRLASGKPKYVGPTGHTPPLFWAQRLSSATTLVIVEGELNALSLRAGWNHCDIVSPGSATNFGSKEAELLSLAGQYDKVIIWTDDDSAGISAVWHVMPVLINRGIKTTCITQELDANDILVKHGAGAVDDVINNAARGLE